MKNIKQSIKNKAKATGEFISDHADIIIPVATATVTITYAVLRIKSYNKQVKKNEEQIRKNEELTKDVREYVINSVTTNGEEHGWVNWGGFIYANHNQDPKELLEQMITDISNNSILIDEA